MPIAYRIKYKAFAPLYHIRFHQSSKTCVRVSQSFFFYVVTCESCSFSFHRVRYLSRIRRRIWIMLKCIAYLSMNIISLFYCNIYWGASHIPCLIHTHRWVSNPNYKIALNSSSPTSPLFSTISSYLPTSIVKVPIIYRFLRRFPRFNKARLLSPQEKKTKEDTVDILEDSVTLNNNNLQINLTRDCINERNTHTPNRKKIWITGGCPTKTRKDNQYFELNDG